MMKHCIIKLRKYNFSGRFSKFKTDIWFSFLVVLELCAGYPWSLIFLRTKRQACNANEEFTCTSGQCIQTFSMCDGSKECDDGSDETSSVCKQLDIKCPSRTFKCDYGACIDDNKKCNGVKDCADGSDEDPQLCPQTSNPSTSGRNCKDNEFRCTSGQCIDEFSICDAVKHCTDGSDETETLCSVISCPNYTFRCKYGACIEYKMKCDGKVDCADGSDEASGLCLTGGVTETPRPVVTSPTPPTPVYPITTSLNGGCTLPQPPEFGFYSSTLCQPGDNSLACNQVPGTTVPKNWVLNYKCQHGFQLPQNYQYAVCLDGKWTPFLPTCTKLCPKVVSLSVDWKCTYQGSPVNCGQAMLPGTKVIGTCNVNYIQRVIDAPGYPELECQDDGSWNEPIYYCTPACGIANTANVAESLISHANPTDHGDYPWHVGLYQRNEYKEWDQSCGGTLINPHIVLTAAHCVYDDTIRGKVDVSEVKIGLGKYYRDWNKMEEGQEKRDVKEIVVAPLYEGKKSSYAHDIALIDLETSVRVTNFIMPACIDWQRKFTPMPGMFGTLTGWGKTEQNTSSPVLLTAQLPYIERNQCRKEVPDNFQHYITPDKFCAGYKNGTGAGKGDSGSGLTFVHKDGLHRVYGIVSTTVKNQQTYATYTNVTNIELLQWLINEQRKLNKKHPNES